MSLEVESKFEVSDLESLRARLKEMGATCSGRRFEQNCVFDTPRSELHEAGKLLRLRYDGRTTLTFKSPVKSFAAHAGQGEEDGSAARQAESAGKTPLLSGVKIMDELETRLDDFTSMRLILEALGFVQVLRYEKMREVWRLPRTAICLDILPFGLFVEIESSPEGIVHAAQLLGLDMAQAGDATYHQLYRKHLESRGLPPADSFVFDKARRAELEQFAASAGD